MTAITVLRLTGVEPVPLMSYLKGLGIFRLVAEQADPNARAAWDADNLLLYTQLSEQQLEEFFLSTYAPSPIAAPWNKDSGFYGQTKSSRLQQLLNSNLQRLAPFAQVLAEIVNWIAQHNWREPPEEKAEFIRALRARMPDSYVRWMDVLLGITPDKPEFAPLFGTGGNDGRLDFTYHFLQRLLTLGIHQPSPPQESRAWLRQCLFARPVQGLLPESIGQFSPGQAGGVNSTTGFEGSALHNPWDYVLMIEGTLLLTGAVVRRLNQASARLSFPFTVQASAVGYPSESQSDSNQARGETWLPLWQRPMSLPELTYLFSEGRAELAGRQAASGLEFARAVASLGVDRGLSEFVRFSFLNRNGKSYFAAPTGRLAVVDRPAVDLLRELDPWLAAWRRAINDKTPARYTMALRRIERAMYDFCAYGGPHRLARVLAACGAAERLIAFGSSFREGKLAPLSGLSARWLEAADDGSTEWALARALASIGHPTRQEDIPPIRCNLEPVQLRRSSTGLRAEWVDNERADVWSVASLPANLAAVLERRLRDGFGKRHAGNVAPSPETLPDADSSNRHSDDWAHPLRALYSAGPSCLLSLLGDPSAPQTLDETYATDLLWAMCAISPTPRAEPVPADLAACRYLPRAYALLKLLFVPRPIHTTAGPVRVPYDPQVITLLRAGRVADACRRGMQLLRAAGLRPMPHPAAGGPSRDQEWADLPGNRNGLRLAAALLVPVHPLVIEAIQDLILRPAEELQTSDELLATT